MQYDIQAIVSAAIVSITSSYLINALFKSGLAKLLTLLTSRLDVAVADNKLSQDTANEIVKQVTTVTTKLETKIDAYVNAGTITNENVNAFLDAVKKRDELFKKILETELGDVE